MFVDAADLDAAGTYRLLVGSIVPRPIAWVTSGVAPDPINLAPFSSFAWVSQHPAMPGFTVNRRPTGRKKDTLRNIERHGQYVINIADETLLEAVHASSEGLAYGVSEVETLGLETAPAVLIDTPRLAAAPIAMECRFERAISFSPTGGDFVVGTVVAWHIRDDVIVDGRISTELLRPLGRLAGPHYTTLGTVVRMPSLPGG